MPQTVPNKTKKAGKSITEFCAEYGISRNTFQNWINKGAAPVLTQPIKRGKIIITAEAEENWKRKFGR